MDAVFLALLALCPTASLGHMLLSWPPALTYEHNPYATSDINYSLTSPITSAAQYPCDGALSLMGTAQGSSVVTYEQGGKYNATLGGSATHNGGSCQFSLSSDNGATFTVIESYIGGCVSVSPAGGSFDFTIPSDAPTGNVVLGWTWFNNEGNREMYQNCASVTIKGSSSKTKRDSVAFSDRPNIFVANVEGVTTCTTADSADVVFPDPGPDVVNTSTNPAAPVGDCGAAASNSTSGSGSESASAVASSATSSASVTPPASSAVSSGASSASATVVASASAATGSAASSGTPGGVFATASGSVAASSAMPTTSAVASTVTPIASTVTPIASASATASSGSNSTSSGAIKAGTACTTEGLWNCIDGSSFQQCASAQWSAVQQMAAGTTCTAGQAMSLSVAKRGAKEEVVKRHAHATHHANFIGSKYNRAFETRYAHPRR